MVNVDELIVVLENLFEEAKSGDLDIFDKITEMRETDYIKNNFPCDGFDPTFFKKITFEIAIREDMLMDSLVDFEGTRKGVRIAAEQVEEGSKDDQILTKIYKLAFNEKLSAMYFFKLRNIFTRKCLELAGDYFCKTGDMFQSLCQLGNHNNHLYKLSLRRMEGIYDELFCIKKELDSISDRWEKLYSEVRKVAEANCSLFPENYCSYPEIGPGICWFIPKIFLTDDERNKVKKEHIERIKAAGGLIKMRLPKWFQVEYEEMIKRKEYHQVVLENKTLLELL